MDKKLTYPVEAIHKGYDNGYKDGYKQAVNDNLALVLSLLNPERKDEVLKQARGDA